MPSYKLTYFDVHGVVEPIRLMLHYHGDAFEDVRVTNEEWAKLKSSAPFGQIPLLEIDGKTVYQSVAIARYLGKTFGLAGKNDWENLEIDMIVDTIMDFRAKMRPGFVEQDEKLKEKNFVDIKANVIPFYLDKLEAIAKANGGHLALGKLTWADFFFAGYSPSLNKLARCDVIASKPNLQAVMDNVTTLKGVKEYIKDHPLK